MSKVAGLAKWTQDMDLALMGRSGLPARETKVGVHRNLNSAGDNRSLTLETVTVTHHRSFCRGTDASTRVAAFKTKR